MANLIDNVSQQIRSIELMPPIHTMMRDLFVHNEGPVSAEEANYDFYKGGIAMAPFVVPGAGGKEMERGSFDNRSLTFPTLAPERTVDYSQYAEQRGFGEALGGNVSADQRLKRMMARDFAYLRSSLALREEWMVAQVIQEGKLDILEYVDGGQTVKATRSADFKFTNQYNPTHKWDTAEAKIYEDFMNMMDIVTKGNASCDVCVFGTDVRNALLTDPRLSEQLDKRNAFYGRVEPDKPNLQKGVQYIGSLSTGMELYCYTGSYRETINGPQKPFIQKGKIMMGSPKMLRCMYGPIAQVEREGDVPKIYNKEVVPFRYSQTGKRSVMQRLTSRPMFLPYNVDAWVVGSVL